MHLGLQRKWSLLEKTSPRCTSCPKLEEKHSNTPWLKMWLSPAPCCLADRILPPLNCSQRATAAARSDDQVGSLVAQDSTPEKTKWHKDLVQSNRVTSHGSVEQTSVPPCYPNCPVTLGQDKSFQSHCENLKKWRGIKRFWNCSWLWKLGHSWSGNCTKGHGGSQFYSHPL